MVSASFVQTSFLGGEWSALAQGRMTDPAYKTGLNVMKNVLPLEAGAAVRRPGARFLAHTKGGHPAVLRAFDFSVTQPYQMEFTTGFIRFYAGLSLLTWEAIEGPVIVDQVFSTNPVKIALNSAVPAGWANGATVVFHLPSIPASCTDLLGRQFIIANLDTSALTFTLKDAITGLDVDGSAFVYNPPPSGSPDDTVERVFELAAPYTTADLDALRVVQDDDNVLILHPSYEPRIITSPVDGSAPFAIAIEQFSDGPYFDINTTTTTLSLSGVGGSVTVTASSTLGINNGNGFVSTDVGRLIRFQGGPAAWSSIVTYAKAAVVLGSDNNIYTSLQGGNINHDPTTDNTATYWQISPTTVAWTWLRITALLTDLTVTATILGDSPLQGTATISWQLGRFSDTTGWPASGSYHEGRLWIAGRFASTTNHVDGSYSNDMFNFKPTADDGTVADANAVSATFRSKEANVIFWMISTDDGLILGTQAGEWRIKASALDDPITPTSIQARRISTYGCADLLPMQPGGQTVFVQRQQRRLLAHQQLTANKYSASNLSQNADQISESGFAEIAWQQEPLLCIWARRADGTLVGCTYREREYSGYAVSKEPFNGWHRHELGLDRDVVSLQSGPAFDGLSETVYIVTNQTDPEVDDFGVHWVQTIMPVFDATIPDWGAYYTDGGATPPYAQLYQTINGDAFDGIRIFGLWPLNGQTVAPVVGGLDLGDVAVADGFCDVHFGSDPDGKFTLAFFTALSDGTDYGVFEVQTGSIVTGSDTNPVVPANTLLAYVGPDSLVVGSSDFITHLDRANDRVIEMKKPKGGDSYYQGGIRILDATTGNETLQHDNQQIFGVPVSLGVWDAGTTYALNDIVTGSDAGFYRSKAGGNIGNDPVGDGDIHWEPRAAAFGIGAELSFLHPDGNIYMSRGASNTSPMSKIDATLLTETVTYGTTSGSLAGSGAGHLQCSFNSMAALVLTQPDATVNNYLIFVGIRNAGIINEITVISTDGAMAFKDAMQITEGFGSVCGNVFGGSGGSSFFVTGQPSLGHWPILWAVGTTYSINNLVYGSDGGSYISMQSSNTGHNPVGDDGTWWTATPQFVGLYHFQYDESSESLFSRPIKKIGPKDIDATWTTMDNMVGPATNGRDILCLFETADSVTNKRYLARLSAADGSLVWAAPIPEGINSLATQQTMSVQDFSCHAGFQHAGIGDHNAFFVDMSDGTVTTQATNTGFTVFSSNQYYDCASGSVTAYMVYSPPGTGPTESFIGDYLANNGDTIAGGWGRHYLGLSCCGAQVITTYTVPVSIGATYTSQGQILRPDYGPDAGTRNGPAFGKKRRIHWDAMALVRSRAVSISTDFDKMYPVKLASDGGTIVQAPGLFTGTVSDTLKSNYSFGEQIAWQVTRPYPCNVAAIGGYLEGMDK